MPEHITWSPPAFSSARAVTAPERNSAAAAPAMSMPLVFVFMVRLLLLGGWCPLDAAARGTLHERPAAARSRPGRTTEAMRPGDDRFVGQGTDVVEVPD